MPAGIKANAIHALSTEKEIYENEKKVVQTSCLEGKNNKNRMHKSFLCVDR